jgi:hypothetical protein
MSGMFLGLIAWLAILKTESLRLDFFDPSEAMLYTKLKNLNSNAWMAIFSGLLVACTVIGFVFQLLAINAARDAADATLDYAKTTDQIMHRQLRAYIMLESCSATIEGDGRLSVRFGLKNFGQTPASDFTVSKNITIAPLDYPGPFTEEEQSNTKRGRTGVGPGQPVASDSVREVIILPDEIEAIKLKAKVIWIHGRCEYKDAFGVEHHTYFRWRTNPGIDYTDHLQPLLASWEGNSWD